MKDKHKLGGAIGAIILYAVGAIYTVAFAISLYKDFWSIPLFVAGAGVCYVVGATMHEGGHILLAKLCGFKVVGFSVGIVGFDFSYKKKISFGISDYAGETDVVPNREGNFLRRYKAVIFGGIAGGFSAFIIISSLYFIFSFNKHIAILFACFPLIAAWVIVNSVPNVIKNSDGSFLSAFEKEENSAPMENYLNILYLLNCGESFSEIDDKLFVEVSDSSIIYEELLTVRLMRAEESGDKDEIAEVIERLKSIENRLADTDKELLIASTLVGDKESVENLKYVLSLCDGEDDLRSMRTLIAYNFLNGDEKYVEVAKRSALKVSKEWYLKGEGRFTELILENF